MSKFSEQIIVFSLSDVKKENKVSQKHVPFHIHKHSELSGLDKDDHPQYLTAKRGIDLFNQLALDIDTDGGDTTGITGAKNLGNGIGIFAQEINDELHFFSIKAGSGISLNLNANTITIDALSSGDVDGGTY